ncbi:PREDICTED: cell division cycle protein 20 homolog [Branchiostoma belcheri]|uniref:Cell division cycle protein 20 homolog n=1 Tax=Branchiostoma belcheri TaxID=7741 RepID=A0A6P4ZY63_BRABE|nr:PREDICTED: cell division cycle protein 20 homolog [Branchiostoma belcheri]KAI8509619.1 ubiquitin-protein transferase activating protein [Branchiostoma belcheri]
MSHLKFENDVNQLLRLDSAFTDGPVPRWQRKAMETSRCSGPSNNTSLNSSCRNMSLNVSGCTPMKTSNRGSAKTPSHTPGRAKTPKSGRKSKTPGKPKTPGGNAKTPKTPTADRFIPNRSASNFELGHFKCNNDKIHVDEEVLSPSKQQYQEVMSENLNGNVVNSKILAYKNKAPQAPEGYQNNMRVLYSQTKTPSSTRKVTRHIPQVPERILDAPEILDDYYLNLLAWSRNNHLAVALGNSVYLWNAGTGEIQQLMSMSGPEDYVSAVSWIAEGNFLAIGSSNAEVQLWDVAAQKRVRNMTSQSSRVGSLDWNVYILSSGSRAGTIHHHDVRIADHHVATLDGHTQEVCGLRWSPDGRYLASGGNDNLLNIWGYQCTREGNTPIHSLTQHQAAVKALSWCPWQPSVLASGGGTADRCIRFWNANTGHCLNTVDTKSQVCSILWSKEHKELISGHGFANNQLIIWKYPTMAKVTELTGHQARVLHMSMSPDGTTVVSAAADETLRLWKCFAVDPQKKPAQKSHPDKKTNTLLRQQIR